MTKEELIRAIDGVPADANIVLADDHGAPLDIEKIIISNTEYGRHGECEASESNLITIV